MHDGVAFAIDLLILLLTGTAAGARVAATVTASTCSSSWSSSYLHLLVPVTGIGGGIGAFSEDDTGISMSALSITRSSLCGLECAVKPTGAHPDDVLPPTCTLGNWLHGATCSFLSFHCFSSSVLGMRCRRQRISATRALQSALCAKLVREWSPSFMASHFLHPGVHPACLCQVRFGNHVRPGHVDILFFSWRWLLNPWIFFLRNFSYVNVTLGSHGWPSILSIS